MARNIGERVEGLGLAGYAGAFGENEIDLDTQQGIDTTDLKGAKALLEALPEKSTG